MINDILISLTFKKTCKIKKDDLFFEKLNTANHDKLQVNFQLISEISLFKLLFSKLNVKINYHEGFSLSQKLQIFVQRILLMNIRKLF